MRAFFTQDILWKLFSLFLAVAIWGTVSKIVNNTPSAAATAGVQNKVTYYDLKVRLVAAEADVQLYRAMPETVTVVVTGAPEAIGELKANQISATVDLTGLTNNPDAKGSVAVAVPPGITVSSVEPAKVSIIAPPPPPK